MYGLEKFCMVQSHSRQPAVCSSIWNYSVSLTCFCKLYLCDVYEMSREDAYTSTAPNGD